MQDKNKTREQLIEELEESRSRVTALMALNELGSKYLEMIEGVSEAVLVVQDGWIKFANSACSELTGYSIEEGLGSNAIEAFVLLDDQDTVNEYHGRRLQGADSPFRYDFRIVCRDGTIKWARMNSSLINWEGKPAALCFISDISDRKAAEQTLNTILSTSPVCIVLIQERRFIWINEFGVNMFGYQNEKEFVGQFTRILYVSDEEYDRVGREIYTDMETGRIAEAQTKFLRKDGSSFDAHIRIKLVDPSAPGNLAIALITDITQSKRRQEMALEGERRFRLLLEDVSSVSVQGYDEDRTVVFWNSASERLYGYSREEALGKRLEDLIIPPHMRDGVIAAVDNWVKNGQRIPAGELELIRKDGSSVPVYSSHVMLDVSDGQKEMYCVDLDLSDLKKGEQERAVLREQLLQAQKMEAVGNLAGGIAHDFNNLLQVVLGFSEVLLRQKKEGDADYGRIQKIYNAGKRGAELVKSLMTFSRRVEPMLCPTDLNREVIEIQDLLTRTIPKTIKIDLHLAGNIKPIQADPSQVNQILMNLALNARDAMPDGGALVIETANVELDEEYCLRHLELIPGPYVLLDVSDTGQGMGKETLEHVFEPFFTTKEVGKGTGLGLATVYGIVRQHNGHIICSSKPGRGTAFRIYFPAIKTKIVSDAPIDETFPPGGIETILLVEDDEVVSELCESLLCDFGYKVITARNGKEALEIFQREADRISLVILDLIMPEMDGRKCLKEILRVDPSAKVLMASGYSENGSVTSRLLKGARGFVRKPYDIRELLHCVRVVLDT